MKLKSIKNIIKKNDELKQNMKINNYWKLAVVEACELTEGVAASFSDIIMKSRTIQRQFMALADGRVFSSLYRDFILCIAVELYEAFYDQGKLAVPLGTKILDGWFCLNGINYCAMKNQLINNKIMPILYNNEKLYQEFFSLYDDPDAKDSIRIFYRKDGENWIRRDAKYSVVVRVNLSKGAELGFCRVGLDYSKIENQNYAKFLNHAYLQNDKEIMIFDNETINDQKKIIWAR